MLNAKSQTRRARARYLAQSIQLEESDVPGVFPTVVFVGALLVGGGVAWASVTPLDEVSKTTGQIIPSGHSHQVQHLEGGIVEHIAVGNGDRVAAGDLLLRLSPALPRSELEQARVQRGDLLLQRERLRALDEDRDPAFGDVGDRYPALAAKQRALFQAEQLSRQTQLSVFTAQGRQREAELERHRQHAAALEHQHELLRERRDMFATLRSRGTVAQADLLSVSAQAAEVEAEYREVRGSIEVTRSAIAETRTRRQELEQTLQEGLRAELARIAAELAQARERVDRLGVRLQRLEIRAPVEGIVNGLAVNTVNQVVRGGEVLMEIVPVGNQMIVQSRISPIDIGHVQVGQAAKVTVDSFDVTRFGDITGRVRHISASTFLDGAQTPYYRVEIVLAKDHVGGDPGRNKVIPGMTVQANVVTGSKSVLDYVLRPVYRGFRSAFRER